MHFRQERSGSKRYMFAAFHLDPANFELRRDGYKIRLARLPLELLILLVERRGNLVTRKDIVAELWQNPGLLETDQNINTAIRQIRSALGDDATHPLFVETVVGKGYRFISPTEEERPLELSGPELSAVPELPQSDPAEQTVLLPPANVPTGLRDHNEPASRKPAWSLLLAGIVVAGIGSLPITRLWRAPALTITNPRQLNPQSGLESSPALAPDGGRVAFLRAKHAEDSKQIFVQGLSGGPKIQLTDFPGGIRCLAWSPTADRIAFLAADPKNNGIVWVVSLSDKSVTKLASLLAPGEVTRLDWSPDGKFIAVGDRPAVSGLFSISLVQIDTSSRRQLTTPPTNSQGDSDPRFSPDGKLVAFRRNWQAGQEEVLVVSVADGKEIGLTRDRRRIGGFSWNADSKSLIVSSARASSIPSLWLIPLNPATRPSRLTGTGEATSEPSVSSSAQRVAWCRSLPSSNIWRVRLDGTGTPEQVTQARNANQEPSVSRDGVLAFRSNRDGDDQIWISHLDGLGAHPITHLHGGLAGSPRWSPDGRYLAFDSREQGNADIFIAACNAASLACEEPQQFTHETSDEVVPGWSADSKTVYFASNRSGRWEVWRQLLFGSEGVQVTQNYGYAPGETPDGRWLIYSKLHDPIGFFRLRLGRASEMAEFSREENIVPRMNFPKAATWTVAGNEFLYIDEFTDQPQVKLLARTLDTGQTRTVLTFTGMPLVRTIALSGDGRWIYYGVASQAESSIMIADLIGS